MKPKTLSRLDLLAAAQEAQAEDALKRAAAALRQSETQRAVLAAYRDRLAAGWQSGAEVDAATALRAVRFAAGAMAAERQIIQAQTQAQARREAAAQELAQLTQRRRKLAQRLGAARAAETTAAEEKLARDLPFTARAVPASGT